MSTSRRETVKYKPHAGQQEVTEHVLKSGASFITISCGRGFGKTFWAMGDIVIPYMFKHPGCQVLWVAPYSSTTRTPIDEFMVPLVPKFSQDETQIWEYKYQRQEMHLINGSKLFFKSADNPDGIISKGYHLIIVDEAAVVPDAVFNQQILACARKGNPLVVLISTPRGKNYFYKYYQYGLDSSKPMYASIKQPYFKNPNYSKVLKELMKDLPEHVIRQEYLAEFIDDGGTVFTGIDKVLQGERVVFDTPRQYWSKFESNISADSDDLYVIAWDLARDQDFNVIVVMNCVTKEIVEYHRYNKVPYNEICDHVKQISNKYNLAEVIYDSTGVGSSIGDFLSREITTIPFKFDNQSKNELVNKLILSIQTEQIAIPNIDTIRHELEAFTFTMTRTGKISYNAPAGLHDDCVVAISLANMYAQDRYSSDTISSIDDILALNKPEPESFRDWMEQDDD